MSSTYAKKVPVIIAEMEQEREDDDKRRQADPTGQPPDKVVYLYPFEGGGIVMTHIPIEDEPEAPVVESRELETDQRPLPRKDPPYFLHFVLLLLLFLVLDSADANLTALFSPTANITVSPQTQALTTTTTFPIGAGPGEVQGRVLPALTISQSQTVQATGRGHQDARAAAGTLIFFNGAFSPQTINAGTVYTGRSGVQVATDQTVTIPAASPPYLGQASVTAHAVNPGSGGNIQAEDIRITTATVQVKNSQFQNGQDARDFSFVTTSDLRQAIYALTSQVQQSEQGALSSQLHTGETLTTPQCTGAFTSSHRAGEEAASAQVTVSQTCMAVAYDLNSLQQAALRFGQGRLAKPRSHYRLIGSIRVTVRSSAMQTSSPTVTAILHGIWVYQINERAIKTLVAGKPRLQAIRLVSKLPGVQTLSISGISDNQPLPEDLSRIHLLIIVEG
jgi:hypothetical protein